MNLIELGKVIRPHGYSGAFVASAISGQSSSLGVLKQIYLGFDREKLTPCDITEAAWMPKGWKVQVTGLSSDAQVKSWIGASIFADRSALPPPAPGEFYVEDLLGAEVVDAATGALIGHFDGVETVPGAADVWWIETAKGQLSVPAVKRYIESVTLAPPCIRLKNVQELEPLS